MTIQVIDRSQTFVSDPNNRNVNGTLIWMDELEASHYEDGSFDLEVCGECEYCHEYMLSNAPDADYYNDAYYYR